MTDDDIIRMARESGLAYDDGEDFDTWEISIGVDEIKHFAALVAKHEREKYEKDAARWQALKTVNGRVQWYWPNSGTVSVTFCEVYSSDFGGLDQAMDAWIERRSRHD